MDGTYTFDLIKEFSRRGIKVLVCSMYTDVAFVYKSLQYGASGYVLKSSDDREIIEAMKAVLAGKDYIPAGMVKILSVTSSVFAMFTNRERQITEYIMEGLDNDEIAKKLGISKRTVENNLSVIYDKAGVTDRNSLKKFLKGKN